jgi:hypothetical protein
MEVRKSAQQKIIPVVCIAGLAMIIAAFGLSFIPESVADTDLRIVLDSPKVRRLLDDQSKLDEAADALNQRKLNEAGDALGVEIIGKMLKYPEKYTPGRSQFLQSMANEPSLDLPKGTYLWTSQKSNAKCFLDAVSSTVFEKVRVVSWHNHGREGWTCGPARPLLGVP